MKDAKMLVIIKNCSVELAEKIIKVINEDKEGADFHAEKGN